MNQACIQKYFLTLTLIPCLLIGLAPDAFAHSTDGHISITNATTNPLYLTINADNMQHGGGITEPSQQCPTQQSSNFPFITAPSTCTYTLSPGSTTKIDLSASVDGWPSSNYDNDEPPDSMYRVWGLNGTTLFYMTGNDRYPIAKTQPNTPNLVDSGCQGQFMLMAYTPQKNTDVAYPSCPAGYTQSGGLCMKFNGDGSHCWNSDEYFSVIVQADPISTYRSMPTFG